MCGIVLSSSGITLDGVTTRSKLQSITAIWDDISHFDGATWTTCLINGVYSISTVRSSDFSKLWAALFLSDLYVKILPARARPTNSIGVLRQQSRSWIFYEWRASQTGEHIVWIQLQNRRTYFIHVHDFGRRDSVLHVDQSSRMRKTWLEFRVQHVYLFHHWFGCYFILCAFFFLLFVNIDLLPEYSNQRIGKLLAHEKPIKI